MNLVIQQQVGASFICSYITAHSQQPTTMDCRHLLYAPPPYPPPLAHPGVYPPPPPLLKSASAIWSEFHPPFGRSQHNPRIRSIACLCSDSYRPKCNTSTVYCYCLLSLRGIICPPPPPSASHPSAYRKNFSKRKNSIMCVFNRIYTMPYPILPYRPHPLPNRTETLKRPAATATTATVTAKKNWEKKKRL